MQRLGRRLGLSETDVQQLGLAEARRGVCRAITRHDFRPDSRWLAAVTGLPLDAVNVALQRLLVDRVQETFQVSADLMQPPPAVSATAGDRFVDAILPLEGRMLSRLVVGSLMQGDLMEAA